MSIGHPTSRPKVSVVMSCYNARRWLNEAIEGVLCQTYENFEFIAIDDGSVDDTFSIIRSYAEKDSRIVPVTKPNSGLADSLNVGIKRASGTWIARLDADDLCMPNRLEEQVRYTNEHPEVGLLGSGFVEIDDAGFPIKSHSYPPDHAGLLERLERSGGFFPHSSAFYRTDLALELGGYNTRIRRAEDWRLWLNFSLRGKLASLPDKLVCIRKHADQISLDNSGRRQLCDAVAATVCHFLRKAGQPDPSELDDLQAWTSFLAWVDRRIDKLDVFEKRCRWVDARDAYFARGYRLTGAYNFAVKLMTSGHAAALLYEKFFGSSLPRKLADEWVTRKEAA